MSDQAPEAAVVPPPIENPVPAKPTYAEELERALADSGLKPKVPNDSKKLEKSEEPKAEEPKPKPEVKEPVTQEKLSSGFAKLERQRKAAARKEAELAEREKQIEALRAEFEKTTTERTAAIEARAADVDRLLKLFDEDEEKCLEELAGRRKTTVEAFYDKLTRRRLNGGVRAPEDQVAEVKSELEALKKEKAEQEAAAKAKEEEAKKAREEEDRKQKMAATLAAENQGFLGFVRLKEKNEETGETRQLYPLLSEESDEDIVNVARQLVADRKVSYKEVADYMEQLLGLQKLKEEKEAVAVKPAEVKSETPKKSAPKAEGKKPEPPKAKTITNSMHGPRSLKSESTPRSDDERLERALAQWK